LQSFDLGTNDSDAIALGARGTAEMGEKINLSEKRSMEKVWADRRVSREMDR
jgi:hypothetical protein